MPNPAPSPEQLQQRLAKRTLPASPQPQAPAVPPPPPPEPEPAAVSGPDADSRGDVYLAERLLAAEGKDLLHNCDNGSWYCWDGRRFRRDQHGEILERAKRVARLITVEIEGEGTALRDQAETIIETAKDGTDEQKRSAAARAAGLRKAARSKDAEGQKIQTLPVLLRMIATAKSHPTVRTSSTDLDAHPQILNCLNGALNLDTGELLPHDRRWRCTRMAAVSFNPAADMGPVLRVIQHLAAGDESVVTWWQDCLGASLYGGNKHEHLYLISGAAGSGKGTLFEAIKQALGDYCAVSEFSTWIVQQGTRIRNDLAGLHGARIVYSSEVQKNSVLDGAVLKAVSGGDTTKSRFLNQEFFEAKTSYTLWLQCNERPRIDHDDPGMWRRVRNWDVPRSQALTDEQRDPDLKSSLLDPARGGEALLAWMVAGCVRSYQAKRLVHPAAIDACSSHYRTGQDPLAEFLQEVTRLAPGRNRQVAVATEDLLAAYARWCERQYLDRRLRMTPNRIRDRLAQLGVVADRKRLGPDNLRAFIGITLAPEWVPEDGAAKVRLANVPLPTEEDHLAELRAAGCSNVPMFQAPEVDLMRTHAREEDKDRTRPHARESLSPPLELWNNGTEKNKTASVDDSEPLDLGADAW